MRVELDEEHQAVILEAETAAERDSLLRTLMYPVPLNPEDVGEEAPTAGGAERVQLKIKGLLRGGRA